MTLSSSGLTAASVSTPTPALQFAPEILLRAQTVRMVFLDVDGVLTDGGLQFTRQGETIKQFSVLDGQGIKLVQRAGIRVAVITGRDSEPLRTRLKALGIEVAVFGTEKKLPAAQAVLSDHQLAWSEAAVMGDDWPDLPLLARAAFACAPPNAHAEVRAVAHHVTASHGGRGAVRELCDLILMAQGHYRRFLDEALQG